MAKISEDRDWLEKNVTLEKGKELLKAIVDARSAYVSYNTEVVKLAMENKPDEAAKVLFGEKRAAQATMAAAIKTFVEFQDKLMGAQGERAAAAYHEARNLMFVLAGSALLMALVVSPTGSLAASRVH